MKKIIIFLFFVSFSASGAGTNSSTDDSAKTSDQIIKLYKLAEKHIDNQSYDKSLKLLKKLTKREDLGTKRADIYNLLGYSYRKLENPDLDKSFAAYMMAIEIDPAHLGAHEYLGELYVVTNRIDLAKERLNVLENCNCKEYDDLKQIIAGTKKSKY